MAKQVLPTNYTDDVLSYSMNGKRRYRETNNYDGTISLEDATTYDRVGSNFGAKQLNDICQAINDSVDKGNVIDTLNDILANRADDMVVGARALRELLEKMSVKEVASNGSWTVKKYVDGWCELSIRAMIPRASTEPYSINLNFPNGIKLKNMKVQVTPALNGWNLTNYYNNSPNQESPTYANSKAIVVFTAKTTQSLTYNFDVVVSGFLAQ